MATAGFCGLKPLLSFRRKGNVFEVSTKKKSLLEGLKGSLTPKKSSSKAQSKGNGESMELSFVGADQLILMVEIHKKIMAFRDIMDFDPCNSSASLREIVMKTLKNLRKLYPRIITKSQVSKIKDKPIDQAMAYFCEALKSLGESWMMDNDCMEKQLNIVLPTCKDNSNMRQLGETMLVTLDCLMKLASERFDIELEEEQKKELYLSPRSSSFGKFIIGGSLNNSFTDSGSYSCGSSPVTPRSVLPELMKFSSRPGGGDSPSTTSCGSPLLWSLRVQAVGKLQNLPIDVKRLSFHKSPPTQIDKIDEEEPMEEDEKPTNPSGTEYLVFDFDESTYDTKKTSDDHHHKTTTSLKPMDEESKEVAQPQSSKPETPSLQQQAQNVPPPPPPSMTTHSKNVPQPPPLPPPLPSNKMMQPMTMPPPPPAPSHVAVPPPPPSAPQLQQSGAAIRMPPPPPPPPPMSSSSSTFATPPPPTMSSTSSSSATTAPPPPMMPLKGGSGSAPAPPPPMMARGIGGGPPPPPPGGGAGRSLRAKATTKLKRSTQLGSLYRTLKGKVEGTNTNLNGKSSGGKKGAVGGASTGGKQGMADALAEMTKRSSYFIQIEEDVQKYTNQIIELRPKITNFKTSDMKELSKFHRDVESVLEKLTDESQVLSRFEGFPTKKLEALRMAAALYNRLNTILTELQNWKMETPMRQLLEKVERYFDKIKTELDALERTKDDEAKKFKGHNIEFDFQILVRIKEAIVDVSSGCMELALKEKRENGSKSEGAKMLWKAFQFAFRVYTFAGGHDDRADKLTKELAQEIESDPNHP